MGRRGEEFVMEKFVKKYAKIYRTALLENNFSDIDVRVESYVHRLQGMYASQDFAKHNVYPTMNVTKIYAVIAMCLELKKDKYTDKEIIDIVNSGFKRLKKILAVAEKIIDSLPTSYKIAKKWNITDYENRIKDGSITYDYFNVTEGKIEYRISKCMYIDMFEYYGIRGLCKIFCLTDESAYANLTRHVKFIRYSDLSDGECCHDEVLDKGYLRE